LAGETEVLGENLPQCCFDHYKPTCCPDANLGQSGEKPVSYGMAKYQGLYQYKITGKNCSFFIFGF
jgi:hypothetical protein